MQILQILISRVTFLVVFSSFCCSSASFGREIFLNGIDISSARSQELENVSVRIDENGRIFIEGTQYSVEVDNNYLPLSKNQAEPIMHPPHRDPIALKKISNLTTAGTLNTATTPKDPQPDLTEPSSAQNTKENPSSLPTNRSTTESPSQTKPN